MTISLTKSQALIAELTAKSPNLTSLLEGTTIERSTLLEWFALTANIKSDNEAYFLIASLRASLLKALNESFNSGPPPQDTSKTSWYVKAGYGVLALAGAIYGACEGFGGGAAIMGLFSSVPNIAIFGAGILFSILSVIVFYSFDLAEISKNLGVKSSETPKLLDILLDEFQQIQAIRARLAKNINQNTKEELEEDLKLAKMLQQRHLDLKEVRDSLTSALDNPYLKISKYVIAAITGIIFFSGGFFAGQTVALAIAGLAVTTTVAATAWPIVVASVAVGLAALSVYWFVQRPGIENLFSSWRGLDKKKIDKLCKSDVVDKETVELQELIDNLDFHSKARDEKQADKTKIAMLEQKVSRLDALEHAKSLLEAEKEMYRLKAEKAEKRASDMSLELVEIKKSQQQTKPKVETMEYTDHDDPDSITVTGPLHNSRAGRSPHQQYTVFNGDRMKRSASTGNLHDFSGAGASNVFK